MKNKISFCLIAVGILIASVPFIGTLYQQHREQQLYQSYLEEPDVPAADRSSTLEIAAEGVSGAEGECSIIAAEGLSETEINLEKKKEERPTVLGRIFIEKIDADLMLVEGAGTKELKWGAGHITGTGIPGETGNCAIAAHRNYTFGSYFSRLDELDLGDNVTVNYLDETFHYKVSDIKTVLPEDNTVLQPPEEGEMLTLVTCAPKGSNRYRLIVHCLPAEDPALAATSEAASQ
jgi:sortase A